MFTRQLCSCVRVLIYRDLRDRVVNGTDNRYRLAIMPVCCYGQSSYKYQIRIGARMLICRDRLRDRIVDGRGWSNSHTVWTKVHLSITQLDQTNIDIDIDIN